MKNYKSIRYLFTAAAVCSLAVLCSFQGCKKDNTGNNKYTNGYTGDTTTLPSSVFSGNDILAGTTASLPAPDFDLPKLIADNIDIKAGEAIDYIANLTIEGAGDTDITEINVNTAAVRPQVPGLYKAVYTVIYRGYPVTKTIVVNVTAAAPDDSTSTTFTSALAGESLGNMPITLSSGEICLIPCTTEHFIVETGSVDTYSKTNGETYRTSILRATFNDGEIIDLETVYTRAINN